MIEESNKCDRKQERTREKRPVESQFCTCKQGINAQSVFVSGSEFGYGIHSDQYR